MSTIWIEIHAYRDFYVDRTLFGPVLRLGWISIGYSRHVLSAWVAAWSEALDRLVKR